MSEWAWACRSHQAEPREMRWLTRSLPFPQGRSLSFKTFLVWVLISIYQGKSRCSCSDACLLSVLSRPSPTRNHIPVHLVIAPPQLSARPFTVQRFFNR